MKTDHRYPDRKAALSREENAREYPARQDTLKEENERLQRELLRQEQTLRKLCFETQDHRDRLDAVEAELASFRKSGLYKLTLLLRRFKIQLLGGKGPDRKDFLKWVWQQLAKKLPVRKPKAYAQPLAKFDRLQGLHQNVQLLLDSMDQTLSLQLGQTSRSLAPKQGRKIFLFAGIPYYDVGGGQRYAQLAKTLNNMGYSVYYIYAFESGESKRFSMYVPCVKHCRLNAYPVETFALDLKEGDAVIFEIPYREFRPYLDYANARGNPTVYEHVDNWDSSLGIYFFNKEEFREFIHAVKHITVSARMLGEKIEEAGRWDYLYCPNAVDSLLFDPNKTYACPADLVTGRKTLLYFGSLWGEWFDWDLIKYVAKNCDCQINLIGDAQSVGDRQRQMPSNVHFLGLKAQTELPAYLQHSDIALLPFRNSVIGKYVSPLKIFEYIAMNKPVLATALDDIAGYPNVTASDDREVWKRTVDAPMELTDTAVFTAENSWYARCKQLLDMIGRPAVSHPTVSAVVLNRNNKNVIFRCVDSLLKFSDAYDMEIIVVDNDSTDGSCEQLAETYADRIRLIRHGKNGCSSGRNLGVQHAKGELLFFLDSDQWIAGAHYLDAALEVLAENKRIGAVGWAAGWFEKDKTGGPITEYLPNKGIKGPWVMYRTDIAYLGSGGLLMKRELFRDIGGFDEAYDPTCFEDTDLSLKIRDAGYELAYCPYMAVVHLPHQTTDSGSRNHTKQMAKNSAYFREKWQKKNPRLLEYYL